MNIKKEELEMSEKEEDLLCELSLLLEEQEEMVSKDFIFEVKDILKI